MSLREYIKKVLGLDYKCEFWCVDRVKCEGYQEDSVACNTDSGIGCGIRNGKLINRKT
jgi:hypothetical protein